MSAVEIEVMAKTDKAAGENSGGDVSEKFRAKREALQSALAQLDADEKAEREALAKAGTDRLVAAMGKEKFGSISKGEATRFAKVVAKLGFANALARLEQA